MKLEYTLDVSNLHCMVLRLVDGPEWSRTVQVSFTIEPVTGHIGGGVDYFVVDCIERMFYAEENTLDETLQALVASLSEGNDEDRVWGRELERHRPFIVLTIDGLLMEAEKL